MHFVITLKGENLFLEVINLFASLMIIIQKINLKLHDHRKTENAVTKKNQLK